MLFNMTSPAIKKNVSVTELKETGPKEPTLKNTELKEIDRTLCWHAFTQMAEYEPFVIERAKGVYLYDLEGKKYLDGVSSLWCNVHGHQHPHINQAIKNQLNQVAHCTSLGMSCVTTLELTKKLGEITPGNLDRVFFSSDGSSGVEVALKMAFQYWQQRSDPLPAKKKYIALANAYHGDTLGSVSVGGVVRFHQMFGPLLFEVIRADSPDPRTVPKEILPAQATEYYLDRLEELLKKHHAEVAAMVLEPLVQCAAGMVMHPVGYLAGVRKLTKKYNVLLIVDEVATGFGRTGKMFACEHEAITPDFLCLGKGLTGGYLPMAATITNEIVFKEFLGKYTESKTLFHGHTFGGNPLAAAAALATLEIFTEEATLENMVAKTLQLESHLKKIAFHPHVKTVRNLGFICAIELVKEKATNTPYDWTLRLGKRICDESTRRGVWIRPLGDLLVIMPPLSITPTEIDILMNEVATAIETVTKTLP